MAQRHTKEQAAQAKAPCCRDCRQEHGKKAALQDHRQEARGAGQNGPQPPVAPLPLERASQAEQAGVDAEQQGIARHPVGEIGRPEAVSRQDTVENQGQKRIPRLQQEKFLPLEGRLPALGIEPGL